jgi:hypothetical protein
MQGKEWINNITEKVTHLIPSISYFALRVLVWLGNEAKMDMKGIIHVYKISPGNVRKEVYLWDLVVSRDLGIRCVMVRSDMAQWIDSL